MQRNEEIDYLLTEEEMRKFIHNLQIDQNYMLPKNIQRSEISNGRAGNWNSEFFWRLDSEIWDLDPRIRHRTYEILY